MEDGFRINRSDVTGLILCGGKSTRFGSPKSHFLLDGSTLVDRAVRLLSPHVRDVLLSIGDRIADDWPKLELIPDLTPGIGPMAGLQAGMARLQTDWMLALAVDLPMVEHADLDRLFEAAAKDDKAVVARDAQGRLHPLCGLYHASTRDHIENAIARNDFAMIRLLSSLKNVRYVTLPPANLRNINRPDDLF
ncbi:MAG TPA: molybdenum cofactor guanylyltransferase [Rhodothermales bacterium]|nr:molybdenum cofactor guanylyltransferase [Rhodothermales bacterium]